MKCHPADISFPCIKTANYANLCFNFSPPLPPKLCYFIQYSSLLMPQLLAEAKNLIHNKQ